MCYFWVQNLSNVFQLIVCGNQTLRNTQQTQWFPKHRPKICSHNMHGVKPLTAENSPGARPAELQKLKPVQF